MILGVLNWIVKKVALILALYACIIGIMWVGSRYGFIRSIFGYAYGQAGITSEQLKENPNAYQSYPGKLRLLATYKKLKFYQLMYGANNTEEKTTRIPGLTVSSFGYSNLYFLFEEIFLENSYYFKAETKTPFIIDGGSNIGMSVLYFKLLYPESTVLAFEPDKKAFDLLTKNIEQNNLSNTKALNNALSDLRGPINFYTNQNNPGDLRMSMHQREFAHKQTIDAVQLSSFIDKPVDFLKLDIEGAELNVIKELADHYKLHMIKQMVIEYHHHLNNTQDSLSQFLKILQDNGFGYQISAPLGLPTEKNRFQDILIYAYKK